MFNSIQENKSALESGKTLLDILEHYLTRINAHKDLNAYLEVFEESARIEAVRIQEKINNGTAGKLAGSFIGIKDNLCLINHKVSASSKILEGFESLYTATAVQRLIDEDAIILGRLNCDEFAMGSSNEKSAYGPVRNSLNPAYVPGGSSGGSAVAVADGLCTASLGSDTGGSVRQPASWTGTYGLKPTYGSMSRNGLIAYASSFDQIGILANNIEDTALLLEIISGEDEFDATVSQEEVPKYSDLLNSTKKYKIAYIKDCLEHEAIQPEIKSSINSLHNLLL